MAFGAFRRYGLGLRAEPVALGPQALRLGEAAVFVVPNPSPANAHFTPADQTGWYDRLASYLG
jgi:double-stranded uracil-DNA glycosylase